MAEPERCETCGATDRKKCRFDGLDCGCDHPAVVREVEEDLAGWFDDWNYGQIGNGTVNSIK